MSVSPDFAEMLAVIMCEAGLEAIMRQSRRDAPSSDFVLGILPGSDLLGPDEGPLQDEEEIGTGIADAVSAGCAGMANRRRSRGDDGGALVWEEAADTGTGLRICLRPQSGW